jgi:hypothetical protein
VATRAILTISYRDHVVLTHTIQVQNESTGAWYLAYVDAESGEVVNLVDFVSDASVRRVYFGLLSVIYLRSYHSTASFPSHLKILLPGSPSLPTRKIPCPRPTAGTSMARRPRRPHRETTSSHTRAQRPARRPSRAQLTITTMYSTLPPPRPLARTSMLLA